MRAAKKERTHLQQQLAFVSASLPSIPQGKNQLFEDQRDKQAGRDSEKLLVALHSPFWMSHLLC